MISIHMGDTCLLKATDFSRDGARSVSRDLVHDVTIRSDLRLAALFGEAEIATLREGRELWLDIAGGPAPRRLRLVHMEDEDAEGAFVIYESGSIFDIHDVTLAHLLHVSTRQRMH